MKKIILGLCLALMADLAQAQGLEKITVEKYYISDAADAAAAAAATSGYKLPVGSVTHRVYVDLAPGAKIVVVTGIPGHELRIATTTEFYNNELGGKTANDMKRTDLKKNTAMLDSWVSLGAASEEDFGVLKTEDKGSVTNTDGVLKNTDPLAGIPLTTADGLLDTALTVPEVSNIGLDLKIFDDGGSNGKLFSTDNGSWYVLGGATGPTAANRVLIGQFTTDGVFSFELNLDIEDANGVITSYVARDAEGDQVEFPDCIYPQKSIAPVVTITSPVNGTKVKNGSTITIKANANDVDGTVKVVEFFYDGGSLGVDSIAPYEIDWAVLPNTEINLKAIATDDKGVKGTSATVKIISSSDAGISDKDVVNSLFKLYPNPTTDILNLEFTTTAKNTVTSYSIYDVTGRLLIQKDLGLLSGKVVEQVDVAALAGGQYIVELSANGVIAAKRIIKK